MQIGDCFQLGVITKTHGIQGGLQVWLDVDEPEHYKELESVLVLINQELVPFFITRWQLQGDKKAVVYFEDVSSLESAEKLIGTEVYLPDSFLPDLAEDQYFYHQLVGLNVFDGEKFIGEVSAIYNLPGHDLLGLTVAGKEVLIPLADEFLQKVDLKVKRVYVSLPEGLLDIYLEN